MLPLKLWGKWSGDVFVSLLGRMSPLVWKLCADLHIADYYSCVAFRNMRRVICHVYNTMLKSHFCLETICSLYGCTWTVKWMESLKLYLWTKMFIMGVDRFHTEQEYATLCNEAVHCKISFVRCLLFLLLMRLQYIQNVHCTSIIYEKQLFFQHQYIPTPYLAQGLICV